MSSILVPGRGLVNASALAVDKAVNEYDERLHFGYNEVNRDWFVYIKMDKDFPSPYRIDGNPVYPVVGFQNTIPIPPKVIDKLREMDTWQNNFDIVKMNHENEKLRNEQRDDGASDEVAERLEHAMRKEGLL